MGDAAIYCEEAAKINVTEAICEAMEAQGVSRAELAKRLGVSRQAVTLLFKRGNLTASHIGRIAHALGCRIVVAFPHHPTAKVTT